MNTFILKSLEVNSTTILPGFGALIKMGRSYVFNEFLKFDDGKLAQVIANEEGIELDIARERLSAFIGELFQDMEKGKPYEISSIGSLQKVDGKILLTVVSAKVKDDTSKTVKKIIPEAPLVSTIPEKKTVIKESSDKKKEDENKVIPPPISLATNASSSSVTKTSIDVSAKEAIQHINGESDKEKLLVYTNGENRKTVLNALEIRLMGLNDTKEAIPKPTPLTTAKPAVPAPSAEKKPIKEEPKSTTAQPNTPISSTVSPERITPIPVSSEKEKQDIAAISEAAERLEKDRKQRKRRRAILWIGIICFLLGGGLLGYLERDYIFGLFDPDQEITKTDETNYSTSSQQPQINVAKRPDSNEIEKDVVLIAADSTQEDSLVAMQAPIDSSSLAEIPVEEVIEDITSLDVVEPEIPVEETVAQPQEVNAGDYHIVAGSFSSNENATKLVSKLVTEGYNASILGKYDGLYIVSGGNYSTRDEAKLALVPFKEQGHKGYVKKW